MAGNPPELQSAFDVAGEPFQRVSCAENPMDMRPALDAIVNMLRNRDPSKKTAILFSEIHHFPLQVALTQAAMERTAREFPDLKQAAGIERSHVLLEKVLEENYVQEITAEQRGKIAAADTDGKQLMAAYMATQMAPGAPVARRNMIAYCQENDISMRALDMAGCALDGEGIDQRDPATRAIVEMHAPHLLDKEIPIDSEDEIRLRNRMICEGLERHLNASGADVYFTSYGGAHLLGAKAKEGITDINYSFEDSLAPLLNRKDINVIIVLPTWNKIFDTGRLPADIDPALRKHTIVIDHSSAQAFWHDAKNPPSPLVGAALLADEAEFLAEISLQSGNALKLFPAASIHPQSSFQHNNSGLGVLALES